MKSKIALREFTLSVLDLPIASHQFLVLKDEQGKIISQAHGIAVNNNNEFQSVSFGGEDRLKAVIYPPRENHSTLSAKSFTGLVQPGQEEKTLREGSWEEMEKLWDGCILNGAETFNLLNARYNPFGGELSNIREGNSNSIARTFCDILGVPHCNISGRLLPGTAKNLLPQEKFKHVYVSNLSSSEVSVAGACAALNPSSLDTLLDLD